MAEEIINGYLQSENTAGDWGTPVSVTIASGVASTAGLRNVTLNSEGAASTDSLTQILGLEIGQDIRIRAASGDYITVTDGANLELSGVNFILNTARDNMVLECISSGVCQEVSRSSND